MCIEKMPKLCLNMIVKNESKIITRLFDSVVDIIDCYCICDTGSTDNTVQLISEYFVARKIPGSIIVEPFKNFEHNRTFALQACKDPANSGGVSADYILLMDADMVLMKGPHFVLEKFKAQLLTADVFHLFQGSDRFSYKNVRIVKNNMGIKYWGVTHEVINTPDGSKYLQIERSTLFIDDVGDGGAKADKFERDIRLLTQGLVEKPNNDRYTFYLANSYRDSGNREKAIEMYKKRIAIGGWFDEVWHSYYSIGRCYNWLGQPHSAIAYWMLAYDYFPKRLENIYEIIHYYRNESKHKLAYEFYRIAQEQLKGVDKSKIDYLFLQNDVYDYKIDYEYSIVGYYYNPENIDMAALSMRVMCAKNIEDSILKNVLVNYKFYCKPLPLTNKSLSNEFFAAEEGFHVSTPSFCVHNGETVVNRRHVNYYIDENGGYVNQYHIITKNSMTIGSKTFELGYNHELDGRYVGLEDMRLFEHNGETHFTANRGTQDGKMRVEYGTIDYENQRVNSSFLTKTDGFNNIEKNWVLFADSNDKLRVVYDWRTSYEIGDTNMLMNKRDMKSPKFFELLRGSTNGIRVSNETWFIAHAVSYEDRRYYYHILVAVNMESGEVKRWSKFFTLEGEKVEYVLGFMQTSDEEFMIGYSKMDKECCIKNVSRADLEKLFV
jgi:tetratricopeptide (TPR) repeat protein